MRTNIVLDPKLVAEARKLTGIKTKRALVEEGLRMLVRISKQKELRKLRGKLTWSGDLGR